MSVVNFPRHRLPGFPRQGGIYEWPQQGRYVVVLSNDDHNEQYNPLCAPVVRIRSQSVFAVELADTDPLGGKVIVNWMAPIPSAELAKEQGMVTGTTWERITVAVHTLFSSIDSPI